MFEKLLRFSVPPDLYSVRLMADSSFSASCIVLNPTLCHIFTTCDQQSEVRPNTTLGFLPVGEVTTAWASRAGQDLPRYRFWQNLCVHQKDEIKSFVRFGGRRFGMQTRRKQVFPAPTGSCVAVRTLVFQSFREPLLIQHNFCWFFIFSNCIYSCLIYDINIYIYIKLTHFAWTQRYAQDGMNVLSLYEEPCFRHFKSDFIANLLKALLGSCCNRYAKRGI